MPTTKTDHPCNGLTKRQRDVFEMVAINQQPVGAERTLESLYKRGLLRRVARKLPGYPPVSVWEYFVPLELHAQWCQWASEVEEDEAIPPSQ